ncbi:ribosome biogenesis GTPase Der [uncultured Nocardioides sp.]|jgi:GTP-binding protein|uniref:ribosome biogenesis GTPase Der n=1 Tax=uncultured Nocardioides sp. TaxID=198441 RepID=UPI0032B1F711
MTEQSDQSLDATPGGDARVPVLAIVGRPNVGKSTLVNRIIGRREAVVEDIPGVTRDRVPYDASWNGRAFTVVDTGGWDPDARGMAQRIAGQAEIAISLADAVLFVVDATVGITDADEAVVRILRKADKPVVLAANKVDDARTEAEAYSLWNLGLGEPYPVSALHGRGSGDMLDAILKALPETPPESEPEIGGPRRIAIVGRPNVGKSSLLNKLAGEERVVVDNAAGTTVDPVDELVELGGRTWRFIDTAGIRKRVKSASGHEYYASLRTATAIDRAEVAVLVLDAQQNISEQDVRILQTVREAGRALVIAFNKWDLVDEERRHFLEREIERELVQVQWAPRINVTARTGWHIDRLVPALDRALEGWETRVGTGALNTFLGRLVAEHPHPVRSGKQPKVLFGTQATTAPPTFILFTSGKLDAAYERFIERRLREEFGFVGTPIVLQQRPREKRKR